MTTRTERDTFGPIEVPADKLWGAQTQRSLQNFDISGEQQPREIIKALAQVKRASAVVSSSRSASRRDSSSATWAAADASRVRPSVSRASAAAISCESAW